MTKRFYKQAAAAPVDGGFAVELDGRAVKTPAGRALILPTRALAEAVAAEWNAQGDEIDPKSMTLMPLCGTAIDRVPDVRDGLIEGLLRYAGTDLLCHRAAHPTDLAQRQFDMWQPLLDWAADELGGRLTPVDGILAVDQDPAAIASFKAVLESFDDWTLTALGELVGISGSLVVGLALAKGRLSVAEAYDVCHVDEDHQRELWGEDSEATKRREGIRTDLQAAYTFMTLSRA
ncbi:MAG TPA: ATP12 family protein [Magnetovibrio sp.]